jgi:hypothetical protein
LFLAAALTTGPALAEDTYRWTDANGKVHATNDPSTIPKGAKGTKGAASESSDTPAGAERPPPSGTEPPPKQSPESDTGAGETQWRARFRKVRERIARLEAAIQTDRATLADPSGHGVNLTFNASGGVVPSAELERVKEHLARSEQELAQARQALDDLDRQASRESVPREWRR